MSEKPENEVNWRERLTPEQYRICREQGTEPAFSGALLYQQQQGTYHCLCCEQALFHANNKYDAGCGWPSFDAPINEYCLRYLKDFSHNMQRIEIRCAQCDAHLGHVFEDGPLPKGERYCVNSISLVFNKKAVVDEK